MTPAVGLCLCSKHGHILVLIGNSVCFDAQTALLQPEFLLQLFTYSVTKARVLSVMMSLPKQRAVHQERALSVQSPLLHFQVICKAHL